VVIGWREREKERERKRRVVIGWREREKEREREREREKGRVQSFVVFFSRLVEEDCFPQRFIF